MIHSTILPTRDPAPLPALPTDLPILYEDDDEDEMGESNLHAMTDAIVYVCLKAHLAANPQYAVYRNMNFYYPGPPSRVSPSPYVSPDVMVVQPFQAPDERLVSYRLNETGPAPLATVEILSRRSYQQRDLAEKMTLYAKIGVLEYILVDVSGEFLPQKLLLKRLQPDGTYKNEQDSDGGVTSRLGFRLMIDTDGRLRVTDSRTGHRYVRPDEAEMETRARRQAEAYAQAEAEARRQAQQQAQAEAEARRQAQQQAQAEAEARRQAQQQAQAEAEARRQAEASAQAEAEARRQAEASAQAEAEARRQAEASVQAEAEARRQAQQQAQAEAEARRLAEDRVKMLEAELARLRAKEKP